MDQIPEKYRSHVKVKKFFYPSKVEVDADGIRRRDAASAEKYKIEFSNVNYAAGLIRISMRREPKSIRRNVQLFGFSKIGNHRNSKI